LNWFNNERRETFAGKVSLKRDNIIECNRFGFGQQRSKSLAPERISHQRQRAAGQAMEGTVCVEQARPSRMSTGEFNGRLDSLTA